MMGDRIAQDPNPDHVEQFLKEANDPLDAIEGDTFDGLYMYYEGCYLYSWDTPARCTRSRATSPPSALGTAPPSLLRAPSRSPRPI